MGATYLSSWIVFRLPQRTLAILVLFNALGGLLSRAETLTGVVYSNELGNGIHPVGRFELEIGKKIHTIEYGEPLRKHFKDERCNDIGAEWSVDVVQIDGSPYANRLSCIGRTDENVHKPYLLARHYIEGLVGTGAHTDNLSPRYRSSSEFRRFIQELSPHDLRFYFSLEHIDKCLKVVSVQPATRTQVATHCGIERQGNYLVLLFDVVRNKTNGKWEIDGIEIQ